METMTVTKGMTTITAKYASTCPVCQRGIQPGDQVAWARGEKARHIACAGGTASAGAATPTAPGPRSITVERDGRRSYLRGDTMPVRGLLRDAGCHWDEDRRAWWIGSHAAALELAERARTAPAEAAPKKKITHCVQCHCSLDDYQIRHGFSFCSSDCADDKRLGGQSGYVDGVWHQGSDD
jgi:hypothetical protein